MMIKARIRWSYIIFAALLAALAGYQSLVAYKVLSFNKAVSQISFSNAITCLALLRIEAQVEQDMQKWLAQGDENSSVKLKESNEDFAISLNQLRSEAAFGKSRQEADRLVQFWNQFTSDLESLRQPSPANQNAQTAAKLNEGLRQVETQIQTVYQTSLESISDQIEAFNGEAQNAARNSWLVAVVALALGVILSFWHYRAVAVPLTQLDEGTRAIAEGKLYVRMDTSRRDEISRIAKNINELTQRLQEWEKSSKSPD